MVAMVTRLHSQVSGKMLAFSFNPLLYTLTWLWSNITDSLSVNQDVSMYSKQTWQHYYEKSYSANNVSPPSGRQSNYTLSTCLYNLCLVSLSASQHGKDKLILCSSCQSLSFLDCNQHRQVIRVLWSKLSSDAHSSWPSEIHRTQVTFITVVFMLTYSYYICCYSCFSLDFLNIKGITTNAPVWKYRHSKFKTPA